MPKVQGKVVDINTQSGRFIAKIEMNRKVPPQGEHVIVKWGKVRSVDQNSLYWKFLEYLMEDGGLKEQYLDKEELHETLKGRFLTTKVKSKSGFDIFKVGSTTDLDKLSFGEYLDKVDKIMVEYCKIDTSSFWKDYKEFYGKY